ncbi:MAG: uroporphyrinogen-III synthase, partial [Ghiorsea sp.]
LLIEYGANPVFFPCFTLEHMMPEMEAGLQTLAATPRQDVDVIFSSRNGVKAMLDAIEHRGASLSETLKGCRIVAVGQKTANVLQQHGCTVALIPQLASQHGLIAAYQQQAQPKRAFFFRAEQGSDALLDYFAEQQVQATLITSYKTRCLEDNPADVVHMLKQQTIDAVLIGSAKTATYYAQKIAQLALPMATAAPVVAVMSKQVAYAADKAGLRVQVIAKQPSFAAMLDGLCHYFSNI